MFSKRLKTDKLTFFRIAYEDKNGRLLWWKPHFYKLVETFGEEAKACFGLPPGARGQRLNLLFTRIERCISDDSAAKDALRIYLVKRCFERNEGLCWHLVDIPVARRLTAHKSRIDQ